MVRVGMKGGEHLAKESEEWAVTLETTFQQALVEAGGQFSDDLSPKALSSDEARQSVVRVRQKYESIWPQIRRKRRGIKKGRYKLGDEIALVPGARDVDSVAFIEAEAQLQTRGRKAFSYLTGGITGPLNAASRYQVSISLLDARSGDIKALLAATALGGKMGQAPETALKDLLARKFRRVSIGGAPIKNKAARK